MLFYCLDSFLSGMLLVLSSLTSLFILFLFSCIVFAFPLAFLSLGYRNCIDRLCNERILCIVFFCIARFGKWCGVECCLVLDFGETRRIPVGWLVFLLVCWMVWSLRHNFLKSPIWGTCLKPVSNAIVLFFL